MNGDWPKFLKRLMAAMNKVVEDMEVALSGIEDGAVGDNQLVTEPELLVSPDLKEIEL